MWQEPFHTDLLSQPANSLIDCKRQKKTGSPSKSWKSQKSAGVDICRGSGLPLLFLLSPTNSHDAPFAQRLLAWDLQFYQIYPRIVRLDTAYWGLSLITWIHAVLGAVAVIVWNPKSQKNRSCLPPTWTKEELGKRSGIERFFGRVFLFFASNALPYVVGLRSPHRWP
jgi:hypothetical protein